jgi:hypothetical protein
MNQGENKTKTDRFGAPKINEQQQYLGPGCYELSREFDKAQIDSKGNALISKETRFKQEHKMGPGPGHYTNEENNPWSKRTYNLLFNNE